MERQHRGGCRKPDLPPHLPWNGVHPAGGAARRHVTSFYDSLRSRGSAPESVWCVHLLLRRCINGGPRPARPLQPSGLCQEPQQKRIKLLPCAWGSSSGYTERRRNNWARSLSSTQDYPAACDNVNSSPCRGPISMSAAPVPTQGTAPADPSTRGGASSGTDTGNRLLCVPNSKTEHRITLHEFYYLHKRILKQAGLPWVAFRNLQHQSWRWGYDAERLYPPLAGGL